MPRNHAKWNLSYRTNKQVKNFMKNVLTADDDEPELSPLCITRTLHLTLPFFCFTPNWVQMRTMMEVVRCCYVSLSTRAGAEIAFCSVELCRLRSVWALLCSLLNTAAAAPLLSTHSPTQRDRAFPGPPISSRAAGNAGVLSELGEEPLALRRWSRGCYSLHLHLKTRFRSSWRQILSDSHDTLQQVLFLRHKRNRNNVCPDELSRRFLMSCGV